MQIANIASGDAILAGDRLRKPPIPTAATSPPPKLVQPAAERSDEVEETGPATTRAEQDAEKPVGGGNMADAIKQINDHLQFQGRNLKFKIDKDTGRTVVQIIDSATDEVLRQIPPQELLDIAKRLGDAEGLLFCGDA
jgi:flagellar protein FlaG